MVLPSADEKPGNPCQQDPNAPIDETVFEGNLPDGHAIDKSEVPAG